MGDARVDPQRRPAAPAVPYAARLVLAIVLTGVAAGVAGTLLTLLLHAVQHLAFGYTEETFQIGVDHASPLRRVVAPAVGGLVVGTGWWLHRRRVDAETVSVTAALRRLAARAAPTSPAATAMTAPTATAPTATAPTATGAGDGDVLPPTATVIDAVLQIVGVGAGASLGREGAPRQAGAAVAGRLAARLGLTPAHRRLLLACGAGAGLAAVYDVPVGGALFTLEALLAAVAPLDVAAAVVTSAIATVVAWPLLGNRPTYDVHLGGAAWPVLIASLLLGPLLGVVGVAFVRLCTAARTHARTGAVLTVTVPFAFAAVGALAVAYPQLLGNGKGPAQLALNGALPLGAAAALIALKPLATAGCLAGGAIGGLLTPSFATGTVVGLVGADLLGHVWSGAPLTELALVGGAALMAVTQRAPLTGLTLAFEFVGGGLAVVPAALVATVLAVATARVLDPTVAPHWLPGGRGFRRI